MVRLNRSSTKKLGELLMEEGLLDKEKLEEALKQQKGSGERLGEVLVRLGRVTEKDIAKIVADQFALPFLGVSQYFLPKDIASILPVETLVENQCVPMDRIGKILLLAISGPVDIKVLEAMEAKAGCELALFVSTTSEIEGALDAHFRKKEGKADAEG